MSKYVDALTSARPNHLYVFDLDRTALNGGTVTDRGRGGVSANISEDAGFAEIEVRPPLIEGLERSNHANVLHDRQVNLANQYHADFVVPNTSPRVVGPTAMENWSMEVVLKLYTHSRGRAGDTLAFILAFNQSDVDGLHAIYDRTTTPATVKFAYREDFDEQSNYEVFRTANSYPIDQIYHLVLVKSFNGYALYVNGSRAASGYVDSTWTSSTVNDTGLRVGGYHSVYHSDSTLQSFALFDRSISTEEAAERYELIGAKDNYEATLDSFNPRIAINNTRDGSIGTIQPDIDKISSGTSSVDFYEDESGTLRLQPTVLAPSTTKSKTEYFDLSGLTAGVSSFIDVTVNTNAQTDFGIFYSVDGTNYTEISEGEDAIPELDANWGSAV